MQLCGVSFRWRARGVCVRCQQEVLRRFLWVFVVAFAPTCFFWQNVSQLGNPSPLLVVSKFSQKKATTLHPPPPSSFQHTSHTNEQRVQSTSSLSHTHTHARKQTPRLARDDEGYHSQTHQAAGRRRRRHPLRLRGRGLRAAGGEEEEGGPAGMVHVTNRVTTLVGAYGQNSN
jgi:hypothetical protein